ncbi:transcription initiation factor TFIID subunit 4B isoform X4 [Gallus gallus]|uniref:transcription initiation factor TFIID subunit 4B isoform X4 n=1 Tax=Gallus gallus TaxID=9031 RepID=UPI000D63E45C|nr:transcription initiation factor TFIID subunit 4B isoform X4 [Gallus gallus]XP_040520338.1 transcription initiation factor TFIID subunit 4B isoform X4 [Gallus gallus]|eukprot:XP_025003675.1 transcription initiation factor TFIID subunit 4B isoform X4 [Gallus gallus]
MSAPAAAAPVRLMPGGHPEQPPAGSPAGAPAPACGSPAAKVPGCPVPSAPSAGPPAVRAAATGGPRPVVVPKGPPTATIQLPANFQLPPGTVLIRSSNGQLMLVSQQAIARAQPQPQNNTSVRLSVPTSTPAVRICAVQNSGTQLIKKAVPTPLKTLSQTTNAVTSTVQSPAVIQPAAATASVTAVTAVKPLSTGTPVKLPVTGPPAQSISQKAVSVKAEGTTVAQTSTSTEMLENVKKCKNFLATLIKLASGSGPQATEMGQNVKNLVQNLLEAKIEPEEFTKKLYVELKSSPQPYLVPFLKVVQQPSGTIVKQVSTLPQSSTLTLQTPVEKRMPLNTLVQTNQFPAGSVLKQVTLPGNKILSLQASPIQKTKIKENGTTSFSRDEDDINDVTSMAGVSITEESACILATNSELIGTVTRSCADEPFLLSEALQKKILNIGKRHDIMELNSDVVNLISHATQERLRGLLEKLTVIAQHRVSTHKGSETYIVSSDTRAQLKFLEKLDHLEKQRKDEEEREMLLRAAKSRSNKEDPEHLRLKQKVKEMQQLELAQMQQREANLTALAAIGPRKKRPLDSSNAGSGTEGLNSNGIAPGSSNFSLTKQLLRPRITRVCLRDLIFCMEQEREMKHSLTLYRALLK